MRALWAALTGLAAVTPAAAQEWEKDFARALDRAGAEKRAILVHFSAGRFGGGKAGEGLLKRSAVEPAAKAMVCVRVPLDKGLPAKWPSFLKSEYLWYGGIAVVSPGGDDGEVKYEHELAGMQPEALAAWLTEAGDRVAPPWESSGYAAEWRAEREGKPVLVLFGRDADLAAPFRGPGLAEVRRQVVVVRVEGDNKRYPCPGAPGAVLVDPADRRELAGWKGALKAEGVKAALAKPLEAWAAGRAEREAKREAGRPYVCGFCGYRSGEGESCCGEGMVKPEPPVWEKTYEAAKERAAAERRVLVVVVLRTAKEMPAYEAVVSEPRLAALAGRAIFYAEEAGEGRGAAACPEGGAAILMGRDAKSEPQVQWRSRGVPTAEGLRRELGSAIRRLRLAGSKK